MSVSPVPAWPGFADPSRRGAEAAWRRLVAVAPWVMDAATFGAVAVLVVMDLAAGQSTALTVSAGLVSLAAVAARRWAALPAFAALAVALAAGLSLLGPAVYVISPAAPVVALSALAVPVVRRQSVPVAVTAALGGAAAIVTPMLWAGGLELVVVVFTILFSGLYASAVGAGIYLRHLDGVQVAAARTARHDERMELARELHDLVAHYVTGIVVQAQAAQVVAGDDPVAATAALVRIEGAGTEALDAMRSMVGSLRGSEAGAGEVAPRTPAAGLADVDDLARTSTDAGVPVRLRVEDRARALVPGAAATSIHRIVQESLTNVHRHARAATGVTVDVWLDGEAVRVVVTDDGRQPVDRAGAPIEGGFGLIGMAERVHALGGTLTAGFVPPPAEGWRVQVALPLEVAAPR